VKATVYILLPVHNRREVTRRFIACLKSQTFQNFHLVLIDDGSTDGTREMARTELADLTVITGHGDWWWAGALQQGYNWLHRQQFAPSDLTLIINDDTEFGAEFLERAVGLMQGQTRTLLLAPSFSRETGRMISSGVRVDWRKMQFMEAAVPDEINCLSTRGLFLTVGDFLELGGFYPKWLPHYLSDYEFTIRACRKGMSLRVDNSLSLLVDEKMTGFHQFDGESFWGFWKKYFSKRSDANPFAWTMFIALTCPWPWKPLGWLRVWYGTAVKILRAMSP
jgi:GT2 family glycosyltransferase